MISLEKSCSLVRWEGGNMRRAVLASPGFFDSAHPLCRNDWHARRRVGKLTSPDRGTGDKWQRKGWAHIWRQQSRCLLWHWVVTMWQGWAIYACSSSSVNTSDIMLAAILYIPIAPPLVGLTHDVVAFSLNITWVKVRETYSSTLEAL